MLDPRRAEALRRLEAFAPRAGRDYAEGRNFDRGPGDRANVSVLSPYVRHRLVTEQEICAAVLDHHSYSAAEKFLQEVCWRTYWKGWLEMRTGVWTSYLAELAGTLDRVDREPPLRERYEAAVSGRSGIDCVDAWAAELIETGYLHNHSRMWFASLWIFTLRLPWTLGADFFLRHLLDGDPASNTLSWRWVAGLQTAGKTYAATPGNIARYTEGRHRPAERFAVDPHPLGGPPIPPARPLPRVRSLAGEGSIGLLLHEDDLAPESLDLRGRPVIAVAAMASPPRRSPLGQADPVTAFTRGAILDGMDLAAAHFGGIPAEPIEADDPAEAVADWAFVHRLDTVAVPHAPVGPARERLDAVADRLDRAGVKLVRVRRDWDESFWPHASKGYFHLKRQIPECLARLGLLGLDRPRRPAMARS